MPDQYWDPAVIVPVYSGLDQIRACLESLLGSDSTVRFRLVVVYDCGPEPQVEEYLRAGAAEHKFELLENSENLGFVKSVNRGLRHTAPRDAVILNSDTIVPSGWLRKILTIAHSAPDIGTVTPMSNNAEIFSFPQTCHNNTLPDDWPVELVDNVLGAVNPAIAIDAPTGVGFCMYMSRAAIESAGGGFDEDAFGKGYGEENDFCQRIIAHGFRNVVCPNTFVFHEGGVSFGEEKKRLIERHSRILGRRHPKYFASVRQFIRNDPLGEFRLAGLLGLLARSERPTILMVGHGLGGGTGRHMQELTAACAEKAFVLCLEPLGDKRLSLSFPPTLREQPLLFDRADDMTALEEVLKAAGLNLVHVHHVMGLEQILERILGVMDCRHIVTLHDYYLIAANPTLSNAEGRFDPAFFGDPKLMAETVRRKVGLSWEQWRTFTERLLCDAQRVIAPDCSVVPAYRSHYPELTIEVAEHPDAERISAYPPVRSGNPENTRVLVLGALGREKGADLLEGVARLARAGESPLELHLVGYAYRPLHRAVHVHGPYQDADLQDLIRRVDPQFVWFPCLWPETYSYTLSAVLEAGLPVVVPHLGALANRTRNRPLSLCLDPMPADQWLAALVQFSRELQAHRGASFEWGGQKPRSGFYTREYLSLPRARSDAALGVDHSILQALLARQPGGSMAVAEWIVHVLVRLRDLPGLRRVTGLIPLDMQRSVKRLLIRRPLHEIEGTRKAIIQERPQ
ncbi:glycosyltransferase [Gilvimarinus sp. F26214L]|uniref:glycosyltransferase n=1 Tax=Gilvimarinus sp. DZF01 TaxID=3461371 RepID=UPI00404563ED